MIPKDTAFAQRMEFAANICDEVMSWTGDSDFDFLARRLRMLAEKWRIQQRDKNSETTELAHTLWKIFGCLVHNQEEYNDYARELIELGWHRREDDES